MTEKHILELLTMTLYHSPCASFIPPRDDLTIPQVIIDGKLNHVIRSRSDGEYPWFIEEATGRTIWKEEVGVAKTQDVTNLGNIY